jgi:aquaporin related protein
MIYISDKEQSRIKRKMAMLPSWMRNDKVGILVFETVGTLILAYGICMGRFLHPIEDRVINRAFDFLISCFFYFALSVAAPFSGGHLNPAVTLALSRKRKDVRIGLYICAQILGGLIGAGIGKHLLI